MIENIIDYTINNFNFGYVISINVLAYLVIQLIGYIAKKKINKGVKIVITCVCSICMFLLYGEISDITKDVLVNSTIIAPISWDWIIKPIAEKLNIDYKE